MSKKNQGGRPPIIDKDVLSKLEDAFMYAYTDKEACLFAGISPATLYRYEELHPEFRERKQLLKLTPNLRFKKTIVDNSGNLSNAQWWATHKMGDEFSPKSRIELNDMTSMDDIDPEDQKAADEFNQRLRANIVKRRLSKRQQS